MLVGQTTSTEMEGWLQAANLLCRSSSPIGMVFSEVLWKPNGLCLVLESFLLMFGPPVEDLVTLWETEIT